MAQTMMAGEKSDSSDRNELAALANDLNTRPGLILWGQGTAGDSEPAPLPDPRLARALPFQVFLTNSQDDELYRALQNAGRRPLRIVGDADLDAWDEKRTILIQMYGCHDCPNGSPVKPREFQKNSPELACLLSRLFATHTVLAVHWDLRDTAFKGFYKNNVNPLPSEQRHPVYALRPKMIDTEDQYYWQRRNWKLLDPGSDDSKTAHTESFLWRLSQTVQKIANEAHPAADTGQDPADTVPLFSGEPYKYLAPFGPEDEEIFRGRQEEIDTLTWQALTQRSVLLLGASGAGKTSLLQAGVIPNLKRLDTNVIYLRPGQNLLAALTNALQSPMEIAPSTAEFHPTQATSIPDLKRLSSHLSGEKTIVVVIDQFEELLVLSAEQEQRAALQALTELVQDPRLTIHLIIAIREDFLAEMYTRVMPWLPHLSDHLLRLEALSPESARQAIEKPARDCGFCFEAQLAERILSDLMSGRQAVYPPHLQIICFRLWQEANRQSERVFTLSSYEQLGGAAQMLSSYLDEALANTTEQGKLARQVLKALVTTEGTRQFLEPDEIARRAALNATQTASTLRELVELRLVNVTQEHGAYELSHEYLVPTIQDWMSDTEEEARHIQDYLRVWLNQSRLLEEQSFKVLEEGALRLNLDLLTAERELLFRSAIQYKFKVVEWLHRLPAEHASGLLQRVVKTSENFEDGPQLAAALLEHPAFYAKQIVAQPEWEYLPKSIRGARFRPLNRQVATLMQIAPPSIQISMLQKLCHFTSQEPPLIHSIQCLCNASLRPVRMAAVQALIKLAPQRVKIWKKGQRIHPLWLASLVALMVSMSLAWGTQFSIIAPALWIGAPAALFLLAIIWMLYISPRNWITNIFRFTAALVLLAGYSSLLEQWGINFVRTIIENVYVKLWNEVDFGTAIPIIVFLLIAIGAGLMWLIWSKVSKSITFVKFSDQSPSTFDQLFRIFQRMVGFVVRIVVWLITLLLLAVSLLTDLLIYFYVYFPENRDLLKEMMHSTSTSLLNFAGWFNLTVTNFCVNLAASTIFEQIFWLLVVIGLGWIVFLLAKEMIYILILQVSCSLLLTLPLMLFYLLHFFDNSTEKIFVINQVVQAVEFLLPGASAWLAQIWVTLTVYFVQMPERFLIDKILLISIPVIVYSMFDKRMLLVILAYLPAFYLYALALPSGLFSITTYLIVTGLCLITALWPSLGNLWRDRNHAWRALGSGIGCGIAAGVSALFFYQQIDMLWVSTVLQVMGTGTFIIFLTLINYKSDRKPWEILDPLETSVICHRRKGKWARLPVRKKVHIHFHHSNVQRAKDALLITLYGWAGWALWASLQYLDLEQPGAHSLSGLTFWVFHQMIHYGWVSLVVSVVYAGSWLWAKIIPRISTATWNQALLQHRFYRWSLFALWMVLWTAIGMFVLQLPLRWVSLQSILPTWEAWTVRLPLHWVSLQSFLPNWDALTTMFTIGLLGGVGVVELLIQWRSGATPIRETAWAKSRTTDPTS